MSLATTMLGRRSFLAFAGGGAFALGGSVWSGETPAAPGPVLVPPTEIRSRDGLLDTALTARPGSLLRPASN
jgi:hypothetical protein